MTEPQGENIKKAQDVLLYFHCIIAEAEQSMRAKNGYSAEDRGMFYAINFNSSSKNMEMKTTT